MINRDASFLVIGPTDLPKLHLVYRLQRSVSVEKMDALEGELCGTVPH